jgi:hypothetical protein
LPGSATAEPATAASSATSATTIAGDGSLRFDSLTSIRMNLLSSPQDFVLHR